jgi:hypothetical protein
MILWIFSVFHRLRHREGPLSRDTQKHEHNMTTNTTRNMKNKSNAGTWTWAPFTPTQKMRKYYAIICTCHHGNFHCHHGWPPYGDHLNSPLSCQLAVATSIYTDYGMERAPRPGIYKNTKIICKQIWPGTWKTNKMLGPGPGSPAPPSLPNDKKAWKQYAMICTCKHGNLHCHHGGPP